MPRARRRRLKRQRKKWGVQPKKSAAQPKIWTVPIIRTVIIPLSVARMLADTTPSLSRADILALAAAAKDPGERRRYRKMLERKE